MSNYSNKTLPNFAPVGYDDWLKKQNANKNTGTKGSLNGGVFKDNTSNSIREAAEKAASQSVSQSVNKQNYLFYDDIIPQGMADGFKEYQAEQAIKGVQNDKKGSVVTGGIPLAGFSPILDNVAKETANDGKTIADLVDDAPKGNDKGKKDDVITSPVASVSPTVNISLEDFGLASDGGFSYQDFQVSDAYVQAMNYTNSLLSQINSGRTSYTDQINALLKEYQNRDKFSYDMSADPLFQQMLASSMNSGKVAMQDTIGQAAALTGGYGSTYGQAAGNAAYNQYISEAYSNLPEYYGLAMDAYNMEGEQMLSELALLQDADNLEYNRLVDAYQANLNSANAMYDREYTDYLNDRNAAEENYWNEKEFNYGAYIDALNQANKDREFNYNAALDEKLFDYEAEQDRLEREERADEREYQRESDLIAALGGESEEYDNLTKSELEHIVDVFIANGGASGNGFEAANQELSVMGKNNFSEDVGNSLVSILEGTRSPVEDYLDAINNMGNISPERKEELIQDVLGKFKAKNYK